MANPMNRVNFLLKVEKSREIFERLDTTDHEHSQPVETAPKPTKKGAALEFNQTPKKYRRRPLTQDEIDLVTVSLPIFFETSRRTFSRSDRWMCLTVLPTTIVLI